MVPGRDDLGRREGLQRVCLESELEMSIGSRDGMGVI
jgi:hypothetical protein